MPTERIVATKLNGADYPPLATALFQRGSPAPPPGAALLLRDIALLIPQRCLV